MSFDAGDVSQFEGRAVDVNVTLSKPSATPVVVPILISGSASASDYSVNTQTLVFSPGQQQATVRVTLADDTENELTETVFLKLSDSLTGAFLGDHVSKRINLQDTDPYVSLIGPTATTYVEQNATLTFQLTLSAPTDEDIAVPIVYSGTAKRDSDFTGPTSVTVSAGQTTKSFSVSLTDDTAAETKETIRVAVGTPISGILRTPSNSTISIEDNDTPVTAYWTSRYVSADEASAAVALDQYGLPVIDANDRTLTVGQKFTIGLTRPADQDVTVLLTYSSEGRVVTVDRQISILGRTINLDSSVVIGNAIGDEDYLQSVKSVVIPKGQTSVTFYVPVLDDHIKEGPETITVTMSSVTNASLPADPSLRNTTFTITDRDVLTAQEISDLEAALASNETVQSAGDEASTRLREIDYENPNREDSAVALLSVIEWGVGVFVTAYTGGNYFAGCAASTVVHAATWTYQVYPDGWDFDYDAIHEDMDSGVYWENLGLELAKNYLKCVAISWASGLWGTGGSSTLGEIGSGVWTVIQEVNGIWDDDGRGVDRLLGKEAGDFIRANDDGWLEVRNDPVGAVRGPIANSVGFSAGSVDRGTVFLDTDFNRVHSSLEPVGLTSSNGQTFIGMLSADINGNGILDTNEGQWVGTGGVDSSVHQTIPVKLVAPANYVEITPTSTLISSMLGDDGFERSKSGIRAAEFQLLKALDLPDRDLSNLQILEAAAGGDTPAAALFAKETQYYNTVVAVATLFDAAGSGMPFDFLATLVFDDLAQKITVPGSTLNLTSPLFVENLLRGVSVRSGIRIEEAVTAAVATALARSNAIIAAEPPQGSHAFLDKVVHSHKFVQAELVQEIAALASGAMSVTEFNAANADMLTRVNAAETFDIVPVYLLVEDVSDTEGQDGAATFATFQVIPTGSSVHGISVDYYTEDRTAVAGEDYLPTSGKLSWAPGDETPRTISVRIVDDNILEANEAFALLLGNPERATVVSKVIHGIVTNDDAFVFSSSPTKTDSLLLSFSNALASVVNDGDTLYKTTAAQGTDIRLNAQSNDLVTLINSGNTTTEQYTDLTGMRTVTIGEHRVELSSGVMLSQDVLAGITGIPNFIFAGGTIPLNATVPLQLNAASLSFEWQVLDIHGSVVEIWRNQEFQYLPSESDASLRLMITDGVSTTTTKHEIHVYPPNVAPTASVVTTEAVTYGTPLTVALADAFDPSAADTAAGFRYAFDLDQAALSTATYDNSSAEASESFLLDAGTHTIYARIIDKDGDFTQYSTSVVVTPATLNVTALAQTKVYGEADPALSYSVSGLQFSDREVAVLSGLLTRAEGEDVGSYAIKQGSLTANANYTVSFSGAQLAITQRPLTVMAVGENKVYDGTTVAIVTLSDNRLPGDDLTVTYGSAHFVDKNVGISKSIAISDITLGGTAATNYTLYGLPVTTADITPRHIAGSFTADNRVYDGTSSAQVLTRLLSNTIPGDDVSLSGGTASFGDRHAGTDKVVSLLGAGLVGEDAQNYLLDLVASARANITPRPASWVTEDSGKIFGESDPDPLTTGFGVGFSKLDEVFARYERELGEDVDDYDITALLNCKTLSAAELANNYDIQNPGAVFAISPATTSVDLNVSMDRPLYGVDSLLLTANVSVVTGAGTPTGTITFYDGTASLGNVELTNGSASLQLDSTTLTAGQRSLRAVFSNLDGNFSSGEANSTINVLAPATIQGLVYVDFNHNGGVDFGEGGVANVKITLAGLDDLGQAVERVVYTDASGVYSFVNLRPSNASGYTLAQEQPSGLDDGLDSLGTVNGSVVGVAGNDLIAGVVITDGVLAENYNFGERPMTTGELGAGQTAGIGFWQNKNGQNLITSLNGGANATQLGNWLAASFGEMYGQLAGKTNAQVASYYKSLFALNAGTAPGGPSKTDAQVMATALAAYVTNHSLAGNVAAGYGFQVTSYGVGAKVFNVGNRGAAFGVAAGSSLSVMDLLLAVNDRSKDRLLYDLDGDGTINSQEQSFRTLAHDLFASINELGAG